MQTPSARFISILQILLENRVEFILVGGVAAVIHGAPVTTFDIDIVHRRTHDNIERLMKALESLDAYYRHVPERLLRPTESHLATLDHQLLLTRFGPLDVLGMIGDKHSYDDLISYAEPMSIVDGSLIMVLSLPFLIQSKVEVGHQKDQATLEILRETLRQKSKT